MSNEVHQDTDQRCLVAHFDEHGPLPACIICSCGDHVRPEDWSRHCGIKEPWWADLTFEGLRLGNHPEEVRLFAKATAMAFGLMIVGVLGGAWIMWEYLR